MAARKTFANFDVEAPLFGHQFRPPCSALLVVISAAHKSPRALLGNRESCSAGVPKLRVGMAFRHALGSSPASQIEIAPYRRDIQFFLHFARSLGLAAEYIRLPCREVRKRRVAHCGKDELGAVSCSPPTQFPSAGAGLGENEFVIRDLA